MFHSVSVQFWIMNMTIFLSVILIVTYTAAPVTSWLASRINRLSNTVCKKNKILLPIKKNVKEINIYCKRRNEIPSKIKEYKNLKRLSITMPLREIPNYVFELSSLEELTLYGMFIEKSFHDIGKLTSLKSLIIRGSGVKQIPSELFELEHLEHLDLSGNKLDALPKDIFKLRALKYLNIGEDDGLGAKRNSIALLPKELFLLPNLEFLDVSGNPLKAIPPEIKNAKSLESLNASSNKLEALPNEIIHTALRSLNVANNSIHTLPIGIEKMHLSNLQIDKSPKLTLTDEQVKMLDRIEEHEKRMSKIF